MQDSRDATVQMTLAQLDNYGPWTVTPEPRRETDLQSLQARLFADFAEFVGHRDGYAFHTRFDNMIAVTNGLDRHDHRRFQETVRNRYPITVSLAVGRGLTPASALGRATTALQSAGSAQDAARTEFLGGDEVEGDRFGGDDRTRSAVTVAHFDVVDATSTFTDRENAYDAHLAIDRASGVLARYMRREHDSLSFFVGGDNVISICATPDASDFEQAVEYVREAVGVDLRVGVGRGRTARAAGHDAKHALETCRRDDRTLYGVGDLDGVDVERVDD